MSNNSKLLWEPSVPFKNNSNLSKYIRWLANEKGLSFANYEALWKWSVEQEADFWESIWQYFKIISHLLHTLN